MKTTFLSLTLAGAVAVGLGLASTALADPPNGMPRPDTHPTVHPGIHGIIIHPHPGIHGIPYHPCVHGIVRPGHGRRCPPPGIYGRRPPGLYGHPHPGLTVHPGGVVTPIKPGGPGFPNGIPVDPAGPGAAAVQH